MTEEQAMAQYGWLDEEDVERPNDPDHEILITLKSGETIYHDCPANWWEDDSWKEDLINALGYSMDEVESTSILG